MNAFASSPCPVESAIALADAHVIKMPLEAGQILSTALTIEYGLAPAAEFNGVKLYKPTHRNHPCVRWAGESRENFRWLAAHGVALCEEYSYRYSTDDRTSVHGSYPLLKALHELYNPDGLTPKPARFVLAMDDEFRQADPHASYRNYLRAKYYGWIFGHGRIKWTRRGLPEWLRDEKFVEALDSLVKSR